MTRADRIAVWSALTLVLIGMFWPYFAEPECGPSQHHTAPTTSIYPQGRPTE